MAVIRRRVRSTRAKSPVSSRERPSVQRDTSTLSAWAISLDSTSSSCFVKPSKESTATVYPEKISAPSRAP